MLCFCYFTFSDTMYIYFDVLINRRYCFSSVITALFDYLYVRTQKLTVFTMKNNKYKKIVILKCNFVFINILLCRKWTLFCFPPVPRHSVLINYISFSVIHILLYLTNPKMFKIGLGIMQWHPQLSAGIWVAGCYTWQLLFTKKLKLWQPNQLC